MPLYPVLTNSLPFYLGRFFTSSTVLTLSLILTTEAGYGSQLESLVKNETSPSVRGLVNREDFPESSQGNFSPVGDQPLELAQLPPSAASRAGLPVPWHGAQMPSGMPPTAHPVATGMPPQPTVSPNWTMVWIPYTMPVQSGMAGQTTQGAQMMTVYLPVWAYVGVAGATPGMAPQGVYPQGGLPPESIPQGMPQAIFPQATLQPGYPQSAAQYPMTPGVPPQGYIAGSGPRVEMPSVGNGSAAAVYGAGFSGVSQTTPPPVQPYAMTGPAGTQSPLAVATVPRSSGLSAHAISLPPQGNQPDSTQPLPQQASVPLNFGPTTNLPAAGSTPSAIPVPQASAGQSTYGNNLTPSGPITPPNLDLQALYVLQGDNSSARARLSGEAFLTPNLLVGGALDLVTGPDLTNDDGVDLTELYLAASVPGAPGLRFRLGQLDLTSYFDRNSFAKDIGRDFFNSNFHTNPALISGANATASRPGGLVQWSVTDDIALNAAVFSSASDITDFALDGFASEVGFRTGNLILRGTFLTARDTQFQGSGGRLDSYGINAEWFIPEVNIGLFGRYGHLNNSGTGFSGDTYSFGLNALDVFMENDRLGLGYGRNLDTTVAEGATPDVLELFYDFEVTPHLRLGFTWQQRDQLQESYAGFRVRGDLDVLPQRSAE